MAFYKDTYRTRPGSNYRRRPLRNQDEVYQKHLEEQVDESNSALSKASGKAKKLRDMMMTIAEKLCDEEYSEKQLGGPNQIFKLSDEELRDFIIQNCYEQRRNLMANIKELQKMYAQEKKDKEVLAQDIIRLKQENKDLNKQIENMEYSIAHTPSVRQSSPSPAEQRQEVQASVEPSENPSQEDLNDLIPDQSQIVVIDGEPYDLSQVAGDLSEYQKLSLKLIGDTGVAEFEDIYSEAQKVPSLASNKSDALRKYFTALEEQKLIEKLKCNVLRNAKLTVLTELGKNVYKYLFGKSPVKSEVNRIEAMHDNLEHGYGIKKMCKNLEMLGFMNVTMDRAECTITLPNKSLYIPDAIAYSPDGKKTYWEYERGNHHEGDFIEKLDKAAIAIGNSSILHIIVDKTDSKKTVEKECMAFKTQKFKSGSKVKLSVRILLLSDMTGDMDKTPIIQLGRDDKRR